MDKDFKDIQSRIRATFLLREGTLTIFLLAVIFLAIKNYVLFIVKINWVIVPLAIWLATSFIFRFLANKQTTTNGINNLFLAYDTLIELPLLTIIIYGIGVGEWIGPLFFLFPIVYTNIVFQRKRAIIVCTVASIYYIALIILPLFDVIPFKYHFMEGLNSREKINYLIDSILFVVASFYLIGLAANLFTELLKKRTFELEEARIKLEEERGSLEIKVKARTKELEETAKSLEKKVQERTKEIQNKMIELEKFNKLAVGREMKMIELKEELEKKEQSLKK